MPQTEPMHPAALAASGPAGHPAGDPALWSILAAVLFHGASVEAGRHCHRPPGAEWVP